ncbi:MAG TPA: sigma-70 family RNA polymerase sigma factor [Candidatus Krumholzibacteria bacterium]|nr:sigma-70 family RNA polymerase sigma factor [Candidatus Krumholzibacteria bacterium]
MDATRDAALIHRMRDRDETALSELYDAYAGFVYSLARGIVRNDGDAEDITQELFFRVWERAGTFDPSRGSPAAWITTMTRRLAIDKTRSRSYQARAREASIDVVPATAAVDGTAAVLSAEANQVLDALNRLDEPYREVIRLSYYEGLSHSGIASRLGTPLGTVKSRLREGVVQLRKLLDIKT